VILRLVNDVPIRGRLISAEGKPIPGVKINVTGVSVPTDRDRFLKALQQDWNAVEPVLTRHLYQPMTKVLRVTASDNNGQFEIAGVGVDRWVGIETIHPAIARGPILIVTHEGLDFMILRLSPRPTPRVTATPTPFTVLPFSILPRPVV
jgi:hypothetical protein